MIANAYDLIAHFRIRDDGGGGEVLIKWPAASLMG